MLYILFKKCPSDIFTVLVIIHILAMNGYHFYWISSSSVGIITHVSNILLWILCFKVFISHFVFQLVVRSASSCYVFLDWAKVALILLYAECKNRQLKINTRCEFSLTLTLLVFTLLSPFPCLFYAHLPPPVGVFLLYLHHGAAGSC